MAKALFVHIGYHKTGSSYLQAQAAFGRAALLQCGVTYPEGSVDQEKSIRKGVPSSGNGINIALALRRRDRSQVFGALNDALWNSTSAKCDRVLLSSEAFFHTFAGTPGSLCMFEQVAKLVGFDIILGLLYLRNPVDHAISTYTHRAQSGKLQSFGDWIVTEYETPGLIESFMNALAVSETH